MAHRHRKKSEDDGVEISLPVTPMLDMSFQLLAFFIFTFKPVEALEGQLDMFLPKSGEAAAKKQEDVDPFKQSDAEIDLKNAVTIKVEVQTDSNGRPTGAVGKVSVVETESTTEIPREQLKAKFKALYAGADNKNNVKIAASAELRYSFLIEIMDACLQAGWKSVGFDPPLP